MTKIKLVIFFFEQRSKLKYQPRVEKAIEQNQILFKQVTNLTLERKDIALIPKGSNLVQQRYTVANVHDIWTVDFTYKVGDSILIIIDLASRSIINALVTPQKVSASKAAYFIRETIYLIEGRNEKSRPCEAGQKVMKKRAPKIVHTDHEPVFRSTEISELFEELKIQHSLTNTRYNRHQNQVSENLHFRKRKESFRLLEN